MDDANDLDPVREDAVEDNISPDWEQSNLPGDVGAGWAKGRIDRENAEFLLDQVEHPVGGRRVVDAM